MSEYTGSGPVAAETCTFAAIAAQLAGSYLHHLVPAFRTPARLICPSNEAELTVVEAMTQASAARDIPVEVIDLRPAPAERLDAVTARLCGRGSKERVAMPTLLILRGFDVFGDDTHEAPTYPFRSEFQFDKKHLWLFIGRDCVRRRRSINRPNYGDQAADCVIRRLPTEAV